MSIPLSLYIHIPWCEKKCPYCDFNSHAAEGALPEKQYINNLISDFRHKYTTHGKERPIQTIFIGGGTPSLFQGESIAKLINHLKEHYPLASPCEITIECNPGSLSAEKIKHFWHAGINRLSIGAQTFNNQCLEGIGRIHTGTTAEKAIQMAVASNIMNINVDLMYALPKTNGTHQSASESLYDIKYAAKLGVTHISHYQLTIEPGTLFAKHTPILPDDNTCQQMDAQSLQLLDALGFPQYEISAYGQMPCQHNLNYWEFGDYIGIGAGAHSKVSDEQKKTISRMINKHVPRQYMQAPAAQNHTTIQIAHSKRTEEFMIGALRLKKGFSTHFFEERTFLPKQALEPKLTQAIEKGLLQKYNNQITSTALGWNFINDTQLMFLED